MRSRFRRSARPDSGSTTFPYRIRQAHEVVLAILQKHEGAFDVALWCDLLEHAAVGKRNESREIGVQPRDVTVAPAAVDDVSRSTTNGIRAHWQGR